MQICNNKNINLHLIAIIKHVEIVEYYSISVNRFFFYYNYLKKNYNLTQLF